jgi:tetratricopeptide (TPR) repeat protein
VRLGLWFLMMTAVALGQPEKARELNSRGLDAVARGDFAAGTAALFEALEIWRSLGPAFAPHAATEMMNLADAMCAQGNWRDGSKLFEQSLELSRQSLGPTHFHTVVNLNRLANVYVVQGKIDRAESLYLEALAVERVSFPNDVQTAHSLAGLSSIHTRAGKCAEGLAEAEEALSITLRAVGENDPETGMAYANVAQIHRAAGHTDRALPLLHKAQVIFERTLGPTHPRVASVLSQEGIALMHENKLTMAEQDLQRAVDLLSKSGNDKVQLAVAEHNLGLLRLRQKKYAEADNLLSQALSLEEQYSIEPGTEMAATLSMLSQIRAKENRPVDAAQLKERASAITSYR